MTYAGNKVINANNIVSMVLILALIVLAIEDTKDRPFFLIMMPVIFLITTAEAFYFEMNDGEFIVKNYLLPLVGIRYGLHEITQIQLLNTNSRSTAKARLKVIRGEKKSMGFSAACLSIKDWQSLINDLRKYKIDVSVESYSLKNYIGIPED